MKLRVGTEEDAEAIASLHTESWRDAYSGILDQAYLAGDIERERLHHWQRAFKCSADFYVTIAEKEGRIVDFV